MVVAVEPLYPRISLNFAISADGKIAGAGRPGGAWTSPTDRTRLSELRCGADALLVGRGTLEADQMTLTVPARLNPSRQPLRCIISRHGRLDPHHKIFSTPGGPIHLLITDTPASSHLPADLATIHHGTLPEFLAILRRNHGVAHLHCEGGGQLARALFELDLVATIHLTWAGHTLFGERDAPTLTGLPGTFLPASRTFTLAHFEPRPDLGECFLTYHRTRQP